MTKLIDELAAELPEDQETRQRRQTDLEAVADAIRAHDRFLVVAHENPDGDALGSMLATDARAARARQGRASCTSRAPRRCRPSTASSTLDEVQRELPADLGERVLLAVDCANERRIGPDAAICRARAARRRHRPPPRQLALRRRQPDRRRRLVDRRDRARPARASSTSQLTPEIAEALYVGLVTDTGRFQYTNTTPKALRLAAELVEAGADVHGIFRHVYETVQFAKLKLLARALERAQLFEGGRLVVSYLLQGRLRRRRRRGAVLRGDHRLPARGRGLGDGRADPRAAARRGAGAPDLAALEPRRGRRLGDRARGGGRRPPAGRRASRRERSIDEIIEFLRREFVARDRRPGPMPPRALSPVGVALVDKPAGPSSFALVAALRRRTRARTGQPARSIRSRPGCWCCCRARRRGSRHASSASTSAT